MTDEQIRAIVTDYDRECAAAMAKRDQRIRAALASGRRQVDIIKATGYSRETIRRITSAAADQ